MQFGGIRVFGSLGRGFSTNKKLKGEPMKQSGLWRLDRGSYIVSYRADDGGNKPLAARR